MQSYKCILMLVLFLGLIGATPVEQKVSKIESKIEFNLSAAANSLKGELRDYRARIFLDKEDFTKSRISFTVNLSNFTLKNPSNDPKLLLVNGLIANLKIEPATFESESISPLAGGKYLVKGVVKRSGQAWEMEFATVPKKISSSKTQLDLSMRGDFNGSEFSIPLSGNAEVVGKVVLENARP